MPRFLDRLVEHLSRQRDRRWARDFSDQLANAFYDIGQKARTAALFKHPHLISPWDAVVEIHDTHPLLSVPILHLVANRLHDHVLARLERPGASDTWHLVGERKFPRPAPARDIAKWADSAIEERATRFEAALEAELALHDLELGHGDVDAVDPHPDEPLSLLSGYFASITISNPGWVTAVRHVDISEDFFLVTTERYVQLTGTYGSGEDRSVKGPVTVKSDPKTLANWIREAIGSLSDQGRPGATSDS